MDQQLATSYTLVAGIGIVILFVARFMVQKNAANRSPKQRIVVPHSVVAKLIYKEELQRNM